MSVGCHAELKIIKGVAKTPGDTQSAEVGLDVIDLLDPAGFSLKSDGWSMNRPSLKNGGLWSDTNLAPGRSLIAGEDGNVTETMQVTLMPGSMPVLAALQSKMERFVQDVRGFQDSFGQIEPVYLKHQVLGEPGPRYALIYNIEVAIEDPDNLTTPIRDLTVTIEREPYWRGLPPGANPKQWAIENIYNTKWLTGNYQLLSGTNHLAITNLKNRAEYNGVIFTTENWINIPADRIPGDAPALIHVSVQQAVSTNATTLMIGKMSKPVEGNILRATGLNMPPFYNLNAGDSVSLIADTTLVADTGAPSGIPGSFRASIAFTTSAAMTDRLIWPLRLTPNRGRFAAFLRARVSATGTVASVQLTTKIDTLPTTTTPVTVSDAGAGGTGNTTDWSLVYLGYISVPNNNLRLATDANRGGISIDSTIAFTIAASRTAGAGSLYIGDLVLFPIDEGAFVINSSIVVGTGASGLRCWTYDNTGCLSHGALDDCAVIQSLQAGTDTATNIEYPEFSGQSIYLTPNVNNRLYFLAYVNSTKRSFINDPSTMTVRVNIIPRWTGIRDV